MNGNSKKPAGVRRLPVDFAALPGDLHLPADLLQVEDGKGAARQHFARALDPVGLVEADLPGVPAVREGGDAESRM